MTWSVAGPVMAVVWRCNFVESITGGDLARVLFVVLQCLLLFELIFVGDMYAAAVNPRRWLPRDRPSLAIHSSSPIRHPRVGSALARKFWLELLHFEET